MRDKIRNLVSDLVSCDMQEKLNNYVVELTLNLGPKWRVVTLNLPREL